MKLKRLNKITLLFQHQIISEFYNFITLKVFKHSLINFKFYDL